MLLKHTRTYMEIIKIPFIKQAILNFTLKKIILKHFKGTGTVYYSTYNNKKQLCGLKSFKTKR